MRKGDQDGLFKEFGVRCKGGFCNSVAEFVDDADDRYF